MQRGRRAAPFAQGRSIPGCTFSWEGHQAQAAGSIQQGMATQQRLTSPEFFTLCSRLSPLLVPLPPLPAPSQPSTTSCFRYVQRSAKQVVPVASQVPAGAASLPANLEHVLAPLPSCEPGPSHRFAFILPAVQEVLVKAQTPGMACIERHLKDHQAPTTLLDAGSPTSISKTRPGCPGPHPTWP